MSTVTELRVNGEAKTIEADDGRMLLYVLREDLGLTGCKYGCGEGKCGACTVLIDGQSTRSCVTRLSTVGDKQIRTIEGLVDGNRLHPVQQAFLDCGAMQCGYCTTGMIMSAVGLLNENPHPERAQIVAGMNGNICRCGTYVRIIAAIEKAALATKGASR
jgi:aerobic-type carbon monoxide dehydrogenase small subunit (CoxS/CutS family)